MCLCVLAALRRVVSEVLLETDQSKEEENQQSILDCFFVRNASLWIGEYRGIRYYTFIHYIIYCSGQDGLANSDNGHVSITEISYAYMHSYTLKCLI